MAIVKRTDPAERFEQRHGFTWRLVKAFPMIAGLCNPNHVNHIDTSTHNLAKMIEAFTAPRWISEVPLDTKIFFYAIELVCHRSGVEGLLPEDFVVQLKRHLSTLTVTEKIDTIDGVSLAFRQCFLWDIPAFLKAYPRPGSLRLKPPTAPKIKPKPLALAAKPSGPKPTSKSLRKRLAKHR